jgi:sulfofructose kinase
LNNISSSSFAVFVGLASWDMIALLPGFPEPDGRVVADSIIEAGGGPAATAAVACARLGVPASFIGPVGDDLRGEQILDALRREQVDTSGAMVIPGAASTAALVLADRTCGTRALCPTLPPDWALRPGSRQAAQIAEAAILHVDHIGYAKVQALYGEPGNTLPLLSIDAGNPIPGLDYRHATLFVPTLPRLAAMFGPAAPARLLRQAAGADWVVATAGAEGAFVQAHGQERIQHIPPFTAAPCRSTLGAGDVFHGALVAAWIRGLPAAEATAYASIAAGFSCQGIDGRSAIPNHATVMEALPAQLNALRELTEV